MLLGPRVDWDVWHAYLQLCQAGVSYHILHPSILVNVRFYTDLPCGQDIGTYHSGQWESF